MHWIANISKYIFTFFNIDERLILMGGSILDVRKIHIGARKNNKKLLSIHWKVNPIVHGGVYGSVVHGGVGGCTC